MTSRSKSFSDISIENYSERSIVVRGDTRKYKEDLKKLGGKYNGRLKDGPGWIFPKKIQGDITNFINSGVRLVSKQEALDGEERTKSWEKKSNGVESSRREEKKSSSCEFQPTIGEYAAMMTLMKKTVEKVTLLEHAVLMLLSVEQKEKLDILMVPRKNRKTNKPEFHRKEIVVEESDNDSGSDDDDDDDDDVPVLRRLMRPR